jgi:integrase
MAGWIMERERRDGMIVFDIGYRVAGRLVKRKGGATRHEAEVALRAALTAIDTGRIRAHTTETVGDYSQRWLDRHAPFVSTGSLTDYRNAVELRIVPTLGAVRLRALTRGQIEQAVAQMQRMRPRRGSSRAGYSAKTINNTLTTLSQILSSAVDDGLIAENPARRAGGARRTLRVHEEFREIDYLHPDEIRAYLAACHPEFHDLAATLALAGLRISEALALQPNDVDPELGLLRVSRSLLDGSPGHLKDKTPRSVEIGPRLGSILRARASACREAGLRILFPDPIQGGYLDRRRIARLWHQPALRDAAIGRHLTVHGLRHTAAAAWLIAGQQSLEYVRRQLGHASIRQTQIYAHLERRGRGTAADATEGGIWGDA